MYSSCDWGDTLLNSCLGESLLESPGLCSAFRAKVPVTDSGHRNFVRMAEIVGMFEWQELLFSQSGSIEIMVSYMG